uniref:Uncharacterized protein n=1 Tax=viral metagenome TaxID=1070528 RepID=A0A2V0RB74_9ZZZZ
MALSATTKGINGVEVTAVDGSELTHEKLELLTMSVTSSRKWDMFVQIGNNDDFDLCLSEVLKITPGLQNNTITVSCMDDFNSLIPEFHARRALHPQMQVCLIVFDNEVLSDIARSSALVIDGDTVISEAGLWPKTPGWWRMHTSEKYLPWTSEGHMNFMFAKALKRCMEDHPQAMVLFNGGQDFVKRHSDLVAVVIETSERILRRNLSSRVRKQRDQGAGDVYASGQEASPATFWPNSYVALSLPITKDKELTDDARRPVFWTKDRSVPGHPTTQDVEWDEHAIPGVDKLKFNDLMEQQLHSQTVEAANDNLEIELLSFVTASKAPVDIWFQGRYFGQNPVQLSLAMSERLEQAGVQSVVLSRSDVHAASEPAIKASGVKPEFGMTFGSGRDCVGDNPYILGGYRTENGVPSTPGERHAVILWKLQLLRSFGLSLSFYVGGSTPKDGVLRKGQSMHSVVCTHGTDALGFARYAGNNKDYVVLVTSEANYEYFVDHLNGLKSEAEREMMENARNGKPTGTPTVELVCPSWEVSARSLCPTRVDDVESDAPPPCKTWFVSLSGDLMNLYDNDRAPHIELRRKASCKAWKVKKGQRFALVNPRLIQPPRTRKRAVVWDVLGLLREEPDNSGYMLAHVTVHFGSEPLESFIPKNVLHFNAFTGLVQRVEEPAGKAYPQPTSIAGSLTNQRDMVEAAAQEGIDIVRGTFEDVPKDTKGIVMATFGAGKSTFVEDSGKQPMYANALDLFKAAAERDNASTFGKLAPRSSDRTGTWTPSEYAPMLNRHMSRAWMDRIDWMRLLSLSANLDYPGDRTSTLNTLWQLSRRDVVGFICVDPELERFKSVMKEIDPSAAALGKYTNKLFAFDARRVIEHNSIGDADVPTVTQSFCEFYWTLRLGIGPWDNERESWKGQPVQSVHHASTYANMHLFSTSPYGGLFGPDGGQQDVVPLYPELMVSGIWDATELIGTKASVKSIDAALGFAFKPGVASSGNVRDYEWVIRDAPVRPVTEGLVQIVGSSKPTAMSFNVEVIGLDMPVETPIVTFAEPVTLMDGATLSISAIERREGRHFAIVYHGDDEMTRGEVELRNETQSDQAVNLPATLLKNGITAILLNRDAIRPDDIVFRPGDRVDAGHTVYLTAIDRAILHIGRQTKRFTYEDVVSKVRMRVQGTDRSGHAILALRLPPLQLRVYLVSVMLNHLRAYDARNFYEWSGQTLGRFHTLADYDAAVDFVRSRPMTKRQSSSLDLLADFIQRMHKTPLESSPGSFYLRELSHKSLCTLMNPPRDK